MEIRSLPIPIDTLKDTMLCAVTTLVHYSNLTFTFYVNPLTKYVTVDVNLSNGKYLVRGRALSNLINVFQNIDFPYVAMPVNIIDKEELTIDNFKEKYRFLVWVN